ncbi:inner membrane protein ypjD, partial [Vibrio parahaemolyticus 861]
SYLKSF